MPKVTVQAGGAGKEKEARTILLKAVNKIYDAVRITLGPEGLNALIYGTYGRPGRITNDGVTVGGVVEFSDELEALAGKAYFEASKRTNERVGDGTTSTAIVAANIIKNIFRSFDDPVGEIRSKSAGLQKSKSPRVLRKELLAESDKVVALIKERAKEVTTLEELEQISIVSIGDEKLGKLVAGIVFETGKDGFVDVVEGNKTEIETEVIKGMRFNAKWCSKAFVTNPEKMLMIAEDFHVVVTNHSIDSALQVASFTQHLETSKIVIFAPDFADNALIAMVQACQKGFMIYPVKCRSLMTEEFEDLACYTGAKFINKDVGLMVEAIKQEDLGFIGRLVVSDDQAIAQGGKGDTSERVKLIQEQILDVKLEAYKNKLKHRLGSMASAVGVIKVGAPTEAEVIFLKHKLEDGQYAARAALQEGSVKGGGLFLKEIAEELPESPLTEALKSCYAQIQENSGGSLEVTDDVRDPAKVVRLIVEHAVSLAANFVTIGFMCAEVREHDSYEGNHEVAGALITNARVSARKASLYIREDGKVAERVAAGAEDAS